MHIEGLPFSTEGYERAKNILKSTYGKDSEVINAYVQNITSLPIVKGNHPSKIHEFYAKLLTSVQALESMGKLDGINGLTRATLDKLEGIKSNLVLLDKTWQDWKFPNLVEALKDWTQRNPITSDHRGASANYAEGNPSRQIRRDNSFQTKQSEWKRKQCVYCEDLDHKSSDCRKVKDVAERREVLRKKRRCFKCTGGNHLAAECRVRTGCFNCGANHYSSICNMKSGEQQVLLTTAEQGIVYPVVVVKVNGVKCRALLDTGAGNSYISSKLIDVLNQKPVAREFRRIDMMMCTTTKKIDVYKITIENLKGDFRMGAHVSRVDKESLLTTVNPRYSDIIRKYPHLKEVEIDDQDQKEQLPIHIILGASDYAKIKTDCRPRIGKLGEPVGEFTKLGWTLISAGAEINTTVMFFAKSSLLDYKKLCNLDVLGLEASKDISDGLVYSDFKEQLTKTEQGYYETGLLWKTDAPKLPDNKQGSLARLDKLAQRLNRQPELFEQYDEIIKDQEEKGIVEQVHHEPESKAFYLPHKHVVRQAAESTKVRVVYDASTRANSASPSLNDCLEKGPPLQNLIWDILTRNRVRPITLAGDIEQAFLQIRVRESDRDVLRFHWVKDKDISKVETFRFTRVVFGLNQSPFILGATIEEHRQKKEREFPREVDEIRRSIYVDDILLSGNTVGEVQALKETTIQIFREAKLELHKWHSNEQVLEQQTDEIDLNDQSFAKQQLGAKRGETKLLGLKWDKKNDMLAIKFPDNQEKVTKRTVLQSVASVYDPLGIVAPVTLEGN